MTETDPAGSTDSIDPDRLKAFAFLLFSKLDGAYTAGMVHLGDRMGLYAAMAESGPTTSVGLAERCGMSERWIREWLHNQGAARLVAHTDGLFSLSPEAVAVMASPRHPAYGMGMFHRLPQSMQSLERLPESFRTGLGFDYDAHGCEGAVGVERSFEPWYRNSLISVAVPALAGLQERLEQGAIAADVGCGAGIAVCLLAEAFPNSEFHGYDISHFALDRAEARKAASGLSNAHFHDAGTTPLPADSSLDLVTTFDCIHDMSHPQEVMGSIRRSIKPDGVWLLVDIKAKDTFEENMRNPMASLMYGASIMSCMASALSVEGGAGLGTLGLSAKRAEAMASVAGFTRFSTLKIDHAMNAFYEVRP